MEKREQRNRELVMVVNQEQYKELIFVNGRKIRERERGSGRIDS